MPFARIVEVIVLAYEAGGPGAMTVVLKYFMETAPSTIITKDLGVVDVVEIVTAINDVATTGSFQWR